LPLLYRIFTENPTSLGQYWRQ